MLKMSSWFSLCTNFYGWLLCKIFFVDFDAEIQPTCRINCENGGSCKKIDGISKCHCLSGFTGPTCQIKGI